MRSHIPMPDGRSYHKMTPSKRQTRGHNTLQRKHRSVSSAAWPPSYRPYGWWAIDHGWKASLCLNFGHAQSWLLHLCSHGSAGPNKLTSSIVLINATTWVTASNKPCPNQYEFFWFWWTPWMEGYHRVSVMSPLQNITNLNCYSGGQSKLKSLIFMLF